MTRSSSLRFLVFLALALGPLRLVSHSQAGTDPAAEPAVASDATYANLDPALRQVIRKFDAAQGGVTALSARFVERKEIGLLKNTVVQEGHFYHSKPDKFLWEYTRPEPKMLLMNGKHLVAYYPEQKQAEEIQTRLSRRLVKYFGLGQVFADLQSYYSLALDPKADLPGARTIVMTPTKKSLAKRLLEVRLWIDEDLQQVRQLEYREQDGDRTLFTFSEIAVNPAIAADRYEIDLPTDVVVSSSFSGFFAEKAR